MDHLVGLKNWPPVQKVLQNNMPPTTMLAWMNKILEQSRIHDKTTASSIYLYYLPVAIYVTNCTVARYQTNTHQLIMISFFNAYKLNSTNELPKHNDKVLSSVTDTQVYYKSCRQVNEWVDTCQTFAQTSPFTYSSSLRLNTSRPLYLTTCFCKTAWWRNISKKRVK